MRTLCRLSVVFGVLLVSVSPLTSPTSTALSNNEGTPVVSATVNPAETSHQQVVAADAIARDQVDLSSAADLAGAVAPSAFTPVPSAPSGSVVKAQPSIGSPASTAAPQVPATAAPATAAPSTVGLASGIPAQSTSVAAAATDLRIQLARRTFRVIRTDSLNYGNTTSTMGAGWCYDPPTCLGYSARSLFDVDVTGLYANGVAPTITSATITVRQVRNAAGPTPTPVNLHEAGTFGQTTGWPGPVGQRLATSWIGGTASAQFDVTGQLTRQLAARHTRVAYALVAPNESNPRSWKEFANNPVLTVTYTYPPAVPSNVTVANAVRCQGLFTSSAQPTFSALAPANQGAPMTLTWQVSTDLFFSAADPTITLDPAIDGLTNSMVYSTTLADGTYYLTAWANYGLQKSALSTAVPFTVLTAAPARPTITVNTFSASGANVAGFTYAFDSGWPPSPTIDTGCLTAASTPDRMSGIVVGNPATLQTQPALAAGPHSLTVKTIDKAGNVSSPTTSYFNL